MPSFVAVSDVARENLAVVSGLSNDLDYPVVRQPRPFAEIRRCRPTGARAGAMERGVVSAGDGSCSSDESET
jgi:hypothetical protein